MTFVKYLSAHLFLAVLALLVGVYISKRFPNLFANIPILNGSLPNLA